MAAARAVWEDARLPPVGRIVWDVAEEGDEFAAHELDVNAICLDQLEPVAACNLDDATQTAAVKPLEVARQ